MLFSVKSLIRRTHQLYSWHLGLERTSINIGLTYHDYYTGKFFQQVIVSNLCTTGNYLSFKHSSSKIRRSTTFKR